MKTKCTNTLVRLTGMTIALALFAGLAGEAKAQYKPTGDDGVSASPRLRQQLDERKARLNTAPATVVSMPGPKCKDEFVKRVDWTARGAHKPTVLIAKHLCASCATTISVEGHGKAKRDVVIHKCSSCGAKTLACCTTKKGNETPTKGMEKN
jgi:hypothetical protein